MFDVIDDSGNEVMGVNGEFLKDSDSSNDKKLSLKLSPKLPRNREKWQKNLFISKKVQYFL